MKPPSLEDLQIPDELFPPETGTQRLMPGEWQGQQMLALLVKRTYTIEPNGKYSIAPVDEQEVLHEDCYLYEKLEPPLVSPVMCDKDYWAFREATDIVFQGAAQTYGDPVRQTTVSMKVGELERRLAVFGERRIEWSASGNHPEFTKPEPFESIPLRYDYAYGGVDHTALERFGVPQGLRDLKKARPEYDWDTVTPFHYPRNPAGKGYLIHCDRETTEERSLPNLEFADRPLNPRMLAVGHPFRWTRGTLPACYDWLSPSWFPRCALLGMTPFLPDEPGTIREVELGWSPDDLLDTPSFLERPIVRPEFYQGASPGLSLRDFDLSVPMEFENLHPRHPHYKLRLPQEIPHARLRGPHLPETDLQPHLNSAVVRFGDKNQVVLVWSMRSAVTRSYSPRQLNDMTIQLEWRR